MAQWNHRRAEAGKEANALAKHYTCCLLSFRERGPHHNVLKDQRKVTNQQPVSKTQLTNIILATVCSWAKYYFKILKQHLILKITEISHKNPDFCLLLKNQEIHGKSGLAIPRGKSCLKPSCSRPLPTVTHSPCCPAAPLTSLTCGHAGMWVVFAQPEEQAGWERLIMIEKMGTEGERSLWVCSNGSKEAWAVLSGPRRPLPESEADRELVRR